MSKTSFKQCRLRKEINSSGEFSYHWITTWIPAHLAVVGKTLDLKDEFALGGWSKGWTVQSAGKHILTPDEMESYSRDHLHQREASDI